MDKLHLPKINYSFSNAGQILIEVLVALSVIVVVVSIVTITTATSLSNVEFSRTQNQATQYAQEGMETIRSLRTSQLATFNALNGSYCLPENSSTLTQSAACSVNIGTTFKRAVVMEKNNIPLCAGGTKTTVTVSWTDGKCSGTSFCHVATISSCIAVTNVVPGL
jgi:Tfp pilus assembly protein PilV